MSAQALSGGQLSLGVNLRDEATLENYISAAGQAPLMASLEALSRGEGEAVIFLHGPRQTGKSHLLQACCQNLAGQALSAPA